MFFFGLLTSLDVDNEVNLFINGVDAMMNDDKNNASLLR